MNKCYIAIDLKSFYASVECASRGLDPLKTNLVVADTSRSEKTICLAVSPSLKSYGIPGRARLFEVIEKVKEINKERIRNTSKNKFIGKSYFNDELINNKNLELDFIAATPRMAKYIEVSTKIYSIYLKYISKEDIYVYSIDEVFIDATPYLSLYKKSAHELAMMMVRDVLRETGITATAGIGTNLYLAKIAMDIVAKHMPADKDGVRVAELDEESYRKKLWEHEPLTDFWRVGRGIATRLSHYGIKTMGDIARCSIENEERLYRLFGVNAELLIDHAWGYEPVDLKEVKSYTPISHSLSSGQVLSCGYEYDKGLLIVKEMTDLLALDLVEKNLVTDQIILSIGYDIDNLKNNDKYSGEVAYDYIGRIVPKPAHGSINLNKFTSSAKLIISSVEKLYKEIVDNSLLIRRVNICAAHTISKDMIKDGAPYQLDIFESYEDHMLKKQLEIKEENEENNLQKTINNLHKKYGKNSVLKGMNYEDGGTTRERNNQIGGHKK